MARICVWCETDISAPATAFPIMYARWGGPDDNWQCADTVACDQRQARLCAKADIDAARFGRQPIARLVA